MKSQVSFLIGAALLGSAAYSASAQENVPLEGPPERLQGTCPPNGYHRPIYGAFGDNDGILRGYEVANPCVLQEAVVAAEVIGMGRFSPIGVKNVQTVRFGATGSLNRIAGSGGSFSDIDIAISYALPAIRITTREGAEGSELSGAVFAQGQAWDEDAPGFNPRAADRGADERRAPLHLLTPFGALLSIIEAEGHATVSNEGGATVLSGTSPYDRLPVRVTLDAQNRPIAVEVMSGTDVYRASFEGYRDDWEPPYLVVFPAQIHWTLNGQALANLEVTRFKSNPYVVFPVPAVAAVE